MDRLSVLDVERERRGQLALVGPDGAELTFEALASLAADDVRSLGPPGEVEAFVAEPTLAAVRRVYAALAAGRTFFPLHPRWTELERAALRERARAGAAAGGLHHGTAALLATSGSTGPSKLACLTRGNLLASADAHAANLPFVEGDRWLLGLPFAHAGGLSILTRCLAHRSAVVLAASSEPGTLLAKIAARRVTLLSVVPTLLARLLEIDRTNVLARLRGVLVGGAAFPESLRRAAEARGIPTLATYGLTETASQVVTEDPSRARGGRDAGRPLRGAVVRVQGPDGPTEEAGVSGEILVGGPMLFAGYVGEPPQDARALLRTGDLGAFDAEGRLEVQGRMSDTIITGGENVHPSEVEGALLSVRGVRDACVFAVADAVWGEVVAAALVLDPGAEPVTIALAANEGLATFRRVRRVAAVPALPTNAMGKVSRRDVARALAGATIAVA